MSNYWLDLEARTEWIRQNTKSDGSVWSNTASGFYTVKTAVEVAKAYAMHHYGRPYPQNDEAQSISEALYSLYATLPASPH